MGEVCERFQAKGEFKGDYVEGKIVCPNYELVLEENVIADEYEKRAFESDYDEIKRVGPPTRPEQAAEPGNYLVKTEKAHTKKRTIYSNRAKISKNFIRIHKLLSSADVHPHLIEKTKYLYENLAKVKNMQGRNLNHIIIALYYCVCRKEKIPISLEDVAIMFPSVTERQVKNAFNFIRNDVLDYEDENGLIEIEKNYILLYIGGNIDKYEVKMLSYEIIENINNNSLLKGKSPSIVAGLSLMLSYKLLSDNSDDIKDIWGIFSTRGTLLKAFEEIKSQLDKVIPTKFTDKIEKLKLSFE